MDEMRSRERVCEENIETKPIKTSQVVAAGWRIPARYRLEQRRVHVAGQDLVWGMQVPPEVKTRYYSEYDRWWEEDEPQT